MFGFTIRRKLNSVYELKRKERIVEQLKIGDEVLTISLLPEEIAKDYVKVQTAIGEARLAADAAKKAGEKDDALVERLGYAIIDLISLLLGKENAEKILVFYEQNYIEMINAITPFISGTIGPKVEASIKDMQRRKRDAIKRARGRR